MNKLFLSCCAMALASVIPAQFFDDFNRADNADLGANWNPEVSTLQLQSNRAFGTTGLSVETVGPFTAGYTGAVVSVDAFAGAAQAGSVRYVAVIYGYVGPATNQALFAKIQDNNGDGLFDAYGLYTGNNSSTGGGVFASLAVPTASARIRAFSPTADSFTFEIDRDMDNIVDESYTRTGISAFAGSLGTKFGLGILNVRASADNYNAVPEPASMVALALGVAVIVRRRTTR